MTLTPKQIDDGIRASLKTSTLEDAARLFYSLGHPRPLYGQNSVMSRTLGENFNGPNSYESRYHDDFKQCERMTEFAEFVGALGEYDHSRTRNRLVEVALEAGDLVFQDVVLDLRHKKNPRYSEAKGSLKLALDYVRGELAKRLIPYELVMRLTKVKYGVRFWLGSNNLPVKNKGLEMDFCLEELDRNH